MRGGQVTDNGRPSKKFSKGLMLTQHRGSNEIHTCIASHYLSVLFSICITALVVINVNHITW